MGRHDSHGYYAEPASLQSTWRRRASVLAAIVFLLAAIALVVMGLWSMAYAGETQAPTPLSARQAAAMYAIAFGQTHLPLPDAPPTIYVIPRAKLQALYGCDTCPVRGLQRGADIYIDEALDFADANDASVLLHEFVHYLQWAAHGEVRDCAEWVERAHEAYIIQAHEIARAGGDVRPLMVTARQALCR